MHTTCLIPARGGSVRIPRKSVRMFHGKPIIAYSIENAQKSGLFDEIVVSTDDDEIANTAAKFGALYVMRPTSDGSQGTQELAGEYLNARPHIGMCCVIYPCAPLLTWRDIVYSRNLLFTSPTRDYAYTVDQRGNDVGGLYWGWAQAFREGAPLKDNAHQWGVRSIDINTEEDFQLAERMYEERHGKQ